MATTVDERIVAAKFDASDFEKGVDKTVKKLDELKKSLDLKGATKSVEELAEKTEASTNSMSKSLEKLTDRFTTFTGMIKQKILGGLADEVANVFLKMERSVKSFISSISSQQVSSGMYRYEQMLTSVRVMMSSGEAEENAYKALETLQSYSDQTSYSLNQMADALSKIRSAGVGLSDATKTVEGIANACASAGINATDAQRAFYNLSQAYSAGFLQYTDYRSLELLNMTTEGFREQMLQAAEAAGTLKKTSEGVYQTINKTNKKVVAGKKVTKDNMRDMLKYNFMTKEAMNKLFGEAYFFDEEKWQEANKKYNGDLEAIKKEYGKVAVEAYLAAREARSFTDVMNTLKDVVATGWSTTFQHLFGKLGEATDFFTDLAEGGLADVIYKIGEYRNAILGYWDFADAEGKGSGGKILRDSILNIAEALGVLFKTFQQILPGFDELENDEEESRKTLHNLGDSLLRLTSQFRETTGSFKTTMENFNKYMNSPIFENGPTRIEALRKVFANLSAIFGIVGKAISVAFYGIGRAFELLSPIFDGILTFLTKVTEPLVDFKNTSTVFKDITYTIDNLFTVLKPVANVLKDVIGFLGEIGKFIAQMALDSLVMNISFFSDVLGLIIELITGNSAQMKEGKGILDGIRADFEGIVEVCSSGINAVKQFFNALISDIRELFGLTRKEGSDNNQNGGIFSGLINFFNTNQFVQDAKAWIDNAIVDIGNFIKSIPERVLKLGENVYDTIWRLFFYEKREDVGGEMKTNVYKTDLAKWFDKVIDEIVKFVLDIPNKIIEGIGKVGNWVDTVFNYLFGERKTSKAGDAKIVDASGKEIEVTIASRFDEFIYNVSASIRTWFTDLPNKIKKLIGGIGTFASNLYKVIDEFLFGKKTYVLGVADDTNRKKQVGYVTKRVKTGFSKWLDGVIKELKKFISNIPEYIKKGIQGVGDIVSTLVNALFGSEDNKNVDSKDIEKKIEAPFLGINLSGVLNTIKEIGVTILNQIARIFTGSDNVEDNQKWFAGKISEGIDWIRVKASSALHWVLEFLSNLPTTIASIFKGEDAENVDRGPIGNAIHNFGLTIGHFIAEDLPGAVLGFIDSAVTEFGNIWDKLYNAVTGENKEDVGDSAKKKVEEEINAVTEETPELTGLQKFVKNLSETIIHIFDELPVWVANGIEMAVIAIGDIVSNIGKWIKGIGVTEEVSNETEQITSESINTMAKSTEKGEKDEEPRLVTAIKAIGERIKELFVTIIPGFISDAWTTIFSVGSQIWDGLVSVFTGDTPNTDIALAVQSLGLKIKEFFTNKETGLPHYISEAFAEIGKIFSGGGSNVDKPISKALKTPNLVNTDDVIHYIKEADKEIKKEVEEPGFWSFIEGAKNGLVNVFNSIGPTIISAISTALQWIGNIASVIVDHLTGEKSIVEVVGEKFPKEESDFKKKLIELGENLKTFFLHTVPKFIGAAIGTLIKEAPKWFAELFGSMGSAMAEGAEEAADNMDSTDTEKAVESATEAVSGITEFIKKLPGMIAQGSLTTAATVIAGLLVLMEIIKLIKDLVTTLNPIQSYAQAQSEKNSLEAVFKRALTALIAGMLLAAYAAKLNPEEFQRTKEVFQMVSDLITTISYIYGGVKIGTGVTDAVKGITNAVSGLKALKNPLLEAKDIQGPLSKGAKTLATGAAAAGTIELVGTSISDVINQFLGNFQNIGSAVNVFAEGLGDAITKFSSYADQVNIAIDIMNIAIDICSKAKTISGYYTYVENAGDTINLLTGSLGTFAGAFKGDIHVKDSIDGIEKLIGMRDAMSEFSEFSKGDVFSQFKYALNTLGAAISTITFDDMRKVGNLTDVEIQSAVDVLEAIVGNDDLISLAKKLKPDLFGNDPKSIYDATENLIVFATALGRLGSALSGFTSEKGDTVKIFFETVDRMHLTSSSDDLANRFTVLGSGLGNFAESIKNLNEDDVKTAEYALTMLAAIGERASKFGKGVLASLIGGSTDLSTFGLAIDSLGSNIGSFFDKVSPIKADGTQITRSIDNIKSALMVVSTLSMAAKNLETTNASALNALFGTAAQDLAGNIGKFIIALSNASLNTKSLSDVNYEAVTKALTSIYSISKAANQISVFGDPAGKLQEFGKGLAYLGDDGNNKGFLIILSEAIRNINDTLIETIDMNKVSKFFDVIKTLAEGLRSMSYINSLGNLHLIEGTATIRELTDSVEELIRKQDVFEALFSIADDFNSSKMKKTQELFDTIKSVGEAISSFGNYIYDGNASFIEGLTNLIAVDPTVLADAVKVISEAIESAFDEDPTLRPKITPIIDIDKETIRKQVSDSIGLEVGSNLDWNALVSAIAGSNSKVDQDRIDSAVLHSEIELVTAAIKDLKDSQVSVGDVTNAFASMKIVTDTGALVGALTDDIDAAIGEKIWLIERSVTPSAVKG